MYLFHLLKIIKKIFLAYKTSRRESNFVHEILISLFHLFLFSELNATRTFKKSKFFLYCNFSTKPQILPRKRR